REVVHPAPDRRRALVFCEEVAVAQRLAPRRELGLVQCRHPQSVTTRLRAPARRTRCVGGAVFGLPFCAWPARGCRPMKVGVSLRSGYGPMDVRTGAQWLVERTRAARDRQLRRR